MGKRILVFYGSYRSDRMGIRLAQYVVERLRRRGDDVELIDAKAINLPMLDRMYKEYPKGKAPEPLERLAGNIRDADGFVFITGEYNWGVQPGLKNLTDHFLEEWFWRPAAIVSYSAGRLSGARAATAWHGNSPNRCFNWFLRSDNRRDQGEALSIRQMADKMRSDHGIDPARVFVTGLSAGGAMTSVRLAT